MSEHDPQTCEAKIDGVWRTISLVEAKGVYAMLPKRCPACHGSVSINGVYSGPVGGLTMTHRKAHGGCPLLPNHFTGTAVLHPKALT